MNFVFEGSGDKAWRLLKETVYEASFWSHGESKSVAVETQSLSWWDDSQQPAPETACREASGLSVPSDWIIQTQRWCARGPWGPDDSILEAHQVRWEKGLADIRLGKEGTAHTFEFHQFRKEEPGTAQDEVKFCYKASWIFKGVWLRVGLETSREREIKEEEKEKGKKVGGGSYMLSSVSI